MSARVAAVNAFANRVAGYVMTSTAIDQWDKRRVAVEAVTVAMEDAWHEVQAIAAMDDAEPLVCTCTEPAPDGVGECQTCRRLVEVHGG